MRWIIILTIFLLGCTPEKPRTIPSPVTSGVTPERTSEVITETTLEATPSPVVPEDCLRGDTIQKIESDDQAREYRLHIPATYDPEHPTALGLGLHGANSTAERFESYSNFSLLANREGFIAAYPQALGTHPAWNTLPGSNDTQFIRDLIDNLARRCNIDPARIYASGASNGGGMVNQLACDLADRVVAIVSVSGAYQRYEDCSPSRPVAIFAIHGTDDSVVPYNGVPEWASGWAQRNKCDRESTEDLDNI